VSISPAAYRIVTALLCAALATLLCWQQHRLPADLLSLLPQLPFILLPVALLIPLFSNHSKELATSLLMLCAYWLIRNHLQAPLQTVPAAQIFYLLCVVLPINVLALIWLPEHGLRHPQGIAIALLPAIGLFLLAQLLVANPGLMADTSRTNIASAIGSIHLSALSAWLYGLAFACAIFSAIWQQQMYASSAVGCALILAITMGWIDVANISAIMFTGLGLLLTINITSGLFHIGFYDELTQIGNRRALLAAAKTAGNQYSLAMIDADHFKKINDRFGHDLGDQALRVIASCISKVGCGAKAFRYGGEEFCLLFKEKSQAEVTDCLEQLRQAIANYDMVIRDKKARPAQCAKGEKNRGASRRHSNLRLTVSVGVVDSSAGGSFEQLIKLADRALYRAKAGGRNRLAFA
jgi:diguanylate cyclase (GGDEF)-like protein